MPAPSPPAPGTRPAGVAAEGAAAHVRAMFDRIAPTYDLANHLLSLSVDRYWRWRTVRALRSRLPPGPLPILDVCCGTGDLSLALAAGLPPGTAIMGADFSLAMLQRARAKSRSARGGHAALPAGKIGANGREPGPPEPASGSGVVVIPEGGPPPGSDSGAAPPGSEAAQRRGGPQGPQAGVSMPPRAVTAGRLTSGTRGAPARRRYSRGRAAAQGPAPTTLQWIQADALRLPYPDASFAAVTSAFGFRNLADYRAGLAEFFRLLTPGGTLAILEISRPSLPVLAQLYPFYFQRLLPRLGGWISGQPAAYRYLPDSVSRFPNPPQLADWMREAGFASVRFSRFAGGLASLHLATRPTAKSSHLG